MQPPEIGSLPARGAWIEIFCPLLSVGPDKRSLPARGAWIEIMYMMGSELKEIVAPREGSVDRNPALAKRFVSGMSRSPRGERG